MADKVRREGEMRKVVIILIITNVLWLVICFSNFGYKLGYEGGYNQGRKDTALSFARAELEGKIYKGYPMVLGNGARLDGCWFISGSTADPLMDLRGNDMTLSNFYIDMVDTAKGTTVIQVSPWFKTALYGAFDIDVNTIDR